MTLSPTDRNALSELVHRYAAGVDDRDFNSVTALFADDAELSVPDPPATLEPVVTHRGHAEIRVAVAAAGAVLRTEHALVGEVYRAGSHPGTAYGRITCIAHHWTRRAEQFTDTAWHVRYDDEYQRTGAEWRIRRRALTINAIETRPVRAVR